MGKGGDRGFQEGRAWSGYAEAAGAAEQGTQSRGEGDRVVEVIGAF